MKSAFYCPVDVIQVQFFAMFNEWIACKIYFMARVFEGRGEALGVRWRQVGLAASSVSRKLSANCCDGQALKIWGLIEDGG